MRRVTSIAERAAKFGFRFDVRGLRDFVLIDERTGETYDFETSDALRDFLRQKRSGSPSGTRSLLRPPPRGLVGAALEPDLGRFLIRDRQKQPGMARNSIPGSIGDLLGNAQRPILRMLTYPSPNRPSPRRTKVPPPSGTLDARSKPRKLSAPSFDTTQPAGAPAAQPSDAERPA